MKNAWGARLCLLVLLTGLAGCAATGTRVTSDGGAYGSMTESQQWWCANAGGCDCSIDGKKATCSLVQACLSAGSCKAAQ